MAEPSPGEIRIRNRPQLRTIEPTSGDRHASWLELFFDLVYVLAVAQTAHILSDHTDVGGFLRYAVLFVPVWYSWVGFTFYADRFETDETIYRVITFAGMLAVIGFSLTLGNAFTPAGDLALCICYVGVRLVLAVLYARAAYHVPLARPYCRQFLIGLSGSMIIMLTSLLFEPPTRYVFWAAALVVEFAVPYLDRKLTRSIPIDRSHIPERLGLFTIIVLGEAVIATASGVGSVEWNLVTVTTASLGFAMATCVWWINFDFVEDNAIRSNSLVKRFVYLYGHFFIVASIVAVGVGVEHSIKESVEPHLHTATLALMAGGLAVYLAVITVVRLVVGRCNLTYIRVLVIGLSLLTIYLGQFLPPLAAVAVLLSLMVMDLLVELRAKPGGVMHETADDPIECEHADQIKVEVPRSNDGCEECRKNNYKWVHLRLCLTCGHVGCCDSSIYKHATKHFHKRGHPIIASLEPGENWAWCYVDEMFVPASKPQDPLVDGPAS